jgi:hypothetical protein
MLGCCGRLLRQLRRYVVGPLRHTVDSSVESTVICSNAATRFTAVVRRWGLTVQLDCKEGFCMGQISNNATQ